MARINIGESVSLELAVPEKKQEQIVREIKVEFDYSKVEPHLVALEAKIDERVNNLSKKIDELPIQQVIETKQILPTETKVVNIVTHDKEDIKTLESELKDIYDELKSDVHSFYKINEDLHQLIRSVDKSDELSSVGLVVKELKHDLNKLKKQNKLLMFVTLAVVILNLL
jgi:hypothetical protein